MVGSFVFILPDQGVELMARPGDSGGPVYLDSAAIAIVSSVLDAASIRRDHDFYGGMFAMSVDHFSSLNLRVITKSPRITRINAATGPHNTDIPVLVEFEGHPMFPITRETNVVSCPPGWNCYPYTQVYQNGQASPLAAC